MPRLGLAMPDRRKKGKNRDCLTTRSYLDIPYFFVVCNVANKNSNVWFCTMFNLGLKGKLSSLYSIGPHIVYVCFGLAVCKTP
jgi:hypothetical protein